MKYLIIREEMTVDEVESWQKPVKDARTQGTVLIMFMEAKGRPDEFKKWNHYYYEIQNQILRSLCTLLHTYISNLK